MKKFYLGLIFIIINGYGYSQIKRADAGPDVFVCKGTGVKIGGNTRDSKFCYSWSPVSGLDDPNDPNPMANPSGKTVYKLTVTGPDFSFKEFDEVMVSIFDGSARFISNAVQKYGYDDGQFLKNDELVNEVWKSVRYGQEDHLNLEISPPEAGEAIYLKSSNEQIVTTDQINSSSSPQQITIKGITSGKVKLEARCGGKEGEIIADINIASYTPIVKTVFVRLVNEKTLGLSKDVSDEAIREYLNLVYRQASIDWNVVRGDDITIDVDLNKDGKIDLLDNDEAQAIITNAKDDRWEKNIFLVNNLWTIPFFGLGTPQKLLGRMDFNQPYGFVDVEACKTTLTAVNTVAHELGHGLGLQHPEKGKCGAEDSSSDYYDPLNVMDYCDKHLLRKFQWDFINPF